MAQEVVMPKLGQTVEEAMIVKWHKKEGDVVGKGDVLFEIETDKAVLEAESFFSGTLLKVLVGENETVPVSSVVAYVGEKGEKVPEVRSQESGVRSQKSEVRAPAKAEERKAVAERRAEDAAVAEPARLAAPPAPKPEARPGRLLISPRAKAVAAKSLVDPSPIRGSGPNGRIVVKDVEAYLEANNYSQIRITPAAKRLARSEKIDILQVRGTGASGRIMIGDVQRSIAERPRPLTKMRQVIARRLTESFTTTPHFYVTISVDMTDLLAYRQQLKKEGVSYTVTDFILEAVVLSLQELPTVNSVCDGQTIRWYGSVDLGVAVSIENGLVVPVIRNADELAMDELRDRARELTTRAREGSLVPDEMTGSTFTVSNMGMLDVENFHAIINPGEAAILAVSSTREQAEVIDGSVAVRAMMKMTLSTDHRIVDGAMGAAFANAVKSKLEDMELWKSLT